jgi:uncharacterized surface protein with fasciclin (FAS1) repeats
MRLRNAALAGMVLLLIGGMLTTGCQYTRGNVVTATAQSSRLSTFHMLLERAELNKTIGKGGPYTVFAPSNDAFDKLPAGTVEDWQKPQNRTQLVKVLNYHIVPGKIMSQNLRDGDTVTTNEGATVTIHERSGQWYFGDARIIDPDITAMNGVVHVVNKVQMP